MIEREWREAKDMRRAPVMLAIILIAAATLRFWALGSGIPFAVGVDEPEIVDRAVRMMKTGDYNPHFFDYPALYMYVQVAVASVRFMAGAMAGEWRSLADVGPADFYLWGRAATALLGTLTVLLVYMTGLRWGTRTALLGAGLLAVFPLHVRESHYVLTDVPLTFCVALGFLLSLATHERGRLSSAAFAGVTAGLAAATKYPGALALLLPLLAVWMTPDLRPSRILGALAVLAGAAAGFLAGAPYTVLDLPAFLDGFAHLMTSYNGQPGAEPPWLLYFKHLRNSVQVPALLLMIGGAIMAIVRAVRGPGRVRWALVVIFPLLYYAFISRQSLVFGRYLLPLTPFVSLLAASAVVSGVSLLRRFSIPRALRTGLIVALTFAALLPAAITSIRFDRTLAKKGTPALAYEWIEQNVPHDAPIIIESRGLVLTGTPFKAKNVRRLIDVEYDQYVADGVSYLIASSQIYGASFAQPHVYPREYAAYMKLFERAALLVTFPATEEHPGPELRVFRVR